MGGNSGGGGSGGRTNGGGVDMNKPVEKMGLDETIKNVYAVRQAITAAESEMSKAYEVSGKEGRELRSGLRETLDKLNKRHTALKNSMTRSEREGMEVITKGKEKKILGKFTGSWSPHYGPI